MTGPDPGSGRGSASGSTDVVVVIPVHDGADRIAATVAAARAIPQVERVLVVDDGSSDTSGELAAAAGAEVQTLARNAGKATAVRAGLVGAGGADVVLLLDADLGESAGAAEALLGPVLSGDADMAVGVLPGVGSRGGFGLVRRLAAAGIRRACGYAAKAPLSGQRAVRREVLDHLGPVERFGLEVALTIDAVRGRARVTEVEVEMGHAPGGRGPAGFRHRAGQGVDVVRALWPRLTTSRQRIGLMVLAALAVVGASTVLTPGSDLGPPLGSGAGSVVVVGVPGLGLSDLARMPTLDRLARDGAMAATNVRTGGDDPRPLAAYATVSSGVRVDAPEGPFVLRRSGTGLQIDDMAAIRAGTGRYATSKPGALGSALESAGRDPAAVVSRPGEASLVAADRQGRVDPGSVLAPRTTPTRAARVVLGLVRSADLVVADPGFTAAVSGSGVARAAERARALARTDQFLASLTAKLPGDTLLLVVGVTPPTEEWALTPTVAWGAGVRGHRLSSPTARRANLVALIDIGPTVLEVLGVERPDGMTGEPLHQRPGTVDRAELHQRDDVARAREANYFRMSITFIVVVSLVNLLTWLLLATGVLAPGTTAARAVPAIRAATLVCVAWPLATFVVRLFPDLMTVGRWIHATPWLVAGLVALVASRFRRHRLAPMAVICGATVAVIVADLATGANLQVASILGTAPHTTYRFNGIGNVAFAVLAATALISVAVHVDAAPRRREAVIFGGLVLAVVALADAAPWMGADVGGLITLVPVFGLTVLALAGRPLGIRLVVLAALATVLLLGVALGIDLLRPVESRTHLARFITDTVSDGDYGETLGRRWAANTRMFAQSAWTWFVLPIALALAWAVARSRWLATRAPLGPGTRVGLLGALAAGVLGWIANDSGVVVTAMVLIFVPSVLTVAALAVVRNQWTELPGIEERYP